MCESTIDQRRPRLLRFELLEAAAQQIDVVGVVDPGDVPAVALKRSGDVVLVGEPGFTVDRDVVVVVDPAEVVELQVAGDRGGFVGDALHQAAVAGDRVDVEVEQLGAVAGALPLRGDRHADRGGDALAERAGGRLDAGGPAVLGVAGSARVELAEAFDVLQRDGRAADDLVVGFDRLHLGEVEQRVEQHRGVPGGEHEAVAARPDRVGRVEAEEALPERVGDGRHRHRRARMPRVRLLDRVDRQRADRVDAELVDGREPIDSEASLRVESRTTVPSPLSATQTASAPTATAPGSGPTSIASPRSLPLSMSMRLTVLSAELATQTESVPASMPPGRSPTEIGSPTRVRVAGSTRVTWSERLSATQTRPPPTVTPAGPRPTGIGRPAVAVAGSMRRTAPVEALLTQTAPAP